jgi:hypothetical protein
MLLCPLFAVAADLNLSVSPCELLACVQLLLEERVYSIWPLLTVLRGC